ncbi:MAG: GAF domain-containing protein [Myxococcales bacterium]|nr:GAF domain-containing protein [Myxococcales bacterium]
MAGEGDSPDNHVFNVRNNTLRYVQDLLRENERLRDITTSLECDRLEIENQLVATRAELDTQANNRALLQERVTKVESDNRRFNEQYAEIEKQNTDLANLYVASYRLHSTLDRSEVVSVIEEIIINLIGSEELAILEQSPESAWSTVGAFGMEPERLEQIVSEIEAGRGVIGKAIAGGERFVAGGQNRDDLAVSEAGLTACVPLVLDGRVTGVIAVFNLLGHKQGLEDIDLQLFDLLASHAATALYSSRESAAATGSTGAK